MRTAEYRAMQAQSMSEKQFQDHVVALAARLGWMIYHTFDSRRSEPGFPDLVLVRRRLMFRELKTASGVLTARQQVWLDELGESGTDAAVWRPRDLMDGTIEKELRR